MRNMVARVRRRVCDRKKVPVDVVPLIAKAALRHWPKYLLKMSGPSGQPGRSHGLPYMVPRHCSVMLSP